MLMDAKLDFQGHQKNILNKVKKNNRLITQAP